MGKKTLDEQTIPERPAYSKTFTQKDVAALSVAGYDAERGVASKMEPAQPQVGIVTQFLLKKNRDGEYQVVEVGQLCKALSFVSKRPGQLAPQFSTWPPEALLRDAFAGPGNAAFDKAPDDLIRKAAAKAATRARLDGNTARTLARAVTALLCVRAGMIAPTVFETV